MQLAGLLRRSCPRSVRPAAELEALDEDENELEKDPTDENEADLFTKELGAHKHYHFSGKVGLAELDDADAG